MTDPDPKDEVSQTPPSDDLTYAEAIEEQEDASDQATLDNSVPAKKTTSSPE